MILISGCFVVEVDDVHDGRITSSVVDELVKEEQTQELVHNT
jgi:hypothetical protein